MSAATCDDAREPRAAKLAQVRIMSETLPLLECRADRPRELPLPAPDRVCVDRQRE